MNEQICSHGRHGCRIAKETAAIRIMKKFRALILYAGIFFALPAQARKETDTLPYTISHYTDENGLPQNSVKLIAPDKEGFLWLATENGLVRFDGARFNTFNSNRMQLLTSRISYIYPSADRQQLLARTEKREVISIRGGQPVQVPPPSTDNRYEYLVCNDTTEVFSLVGLPNVFFPASVKADQFLIPLSKEEYFLTKRDTVTWIRAGRLYRHYPYRHTNRWSFFIMQRQLYHMQADGRLIVFGDNQATAVQLTGDILQHRDFAGHRKEMRLYWNLVAEQVFIYFRKKCYRLQVQANGDVYTSLVTRDFDFDQLHIVSIYQQEGDQRIFLGSRTKGLYVVEWKKFRVLKTGNGVDDVCYAQAPSGQNGVVTPHGIVFNRDGTTKTLPLLHKAGINHDLYSMLMDHQGNYWVKKKNLLYKYNNDCTAKLWEKDMGTEINQLYLSAEGCLWIGIKYAGLYCLQTAEEYPVPSLYSASPKDVTYMMQETPELLWVASGEGLHRLNLRTKQINTISYFDKQYVRSLFVPAENEVWITTYDRGFFLYRNGKVTSMPVDRYQYLLATHCITQDHQGFFWITTNKGLFQASRADLLAYAEGKQSSVYYQYYNTDQGFSTNEFNGGCEPCGWQWKNGDISLPSLEGLVLFNPGRQSAEIPGQGLFLDRAELDARDFPVADTFRLPNSFTRFRFQISSPYFGNPYNLQILYSLSHDEASVWLPAENDRSISFSAMPSGAYHLRVRKINGFGQRNYTEKVWVIIIAHAWYETIWFRLLAIMLTVLLIFAYIHFRMKRVSRQNRILEVRVSERTQELKDTLQDLQVSEEQLRQQGLMQQRMITAVTHDIKTPMKYLMLMAGTLKRSSAGSEDKQHTAMYDALYRMYHLVDNLIQYMKTNVKDHNAIQEITDLHDLLEEKLSIFRPIADSRQIALINEVTPGTKLLVNGQLLAVVVHNLLDNAVKDTVQGSIRVSASLNGQQLELHFRDTGIGMQPAIAEWVNRYSMEEAGEDETRRPHLHNGIGLLMVMELTQLIHGKLAVQPVPDGGTQLTIMLQVLK